MSADAYLLKDLDIILSRGSGDCLMYTSLITMSPEYVSPSESNELSWSLCNQLRQSLAGLDADQRQLKINCFSTDGKYTTRKAIRLHGNWINHLVEQIGVGMKLSVALLDHPIPVDKKEDMYTAGMFPHYSCNDWVLMYEGSLLNASINWPRTKRSAEEIRKKFTIMVSGTPNITLQKPQDVNGAFIKAEQSKHLVLFSNKVFTEQFDTDVEIVSAAGSKHPCHKLFLTGNSTVFQAMFKGNSFKEGRTKSVKLENMSEKGVVALLKFLYCVNSEEIETEYNSEVCMELLDASEKYSMGNLQDSMKRVILKKPCDWIGVDTALQLFCFSRNAENCQELVGKCIQVLKSKHAEMMNSEDYKKLFKKNPEAAMDLCNFLSK